jgi:predicted dehydrogenase
VKAAVAYVYRSHPVLESMRDALLSGRFGKPVEVVVVAGQHFPLYRPAYRDIYYNRHETGGGAIQDALTHMVNAVEWLVGPVDRLVCDAEHLLLDGVDVEDTVHLLTRHGGVLGNFTLNQHQAPNETMLTVHCERGSLRFEAHQSRWVSCVEPGTLWLGEFDRKLERDDLFILQARQFLEYLNDAAPPRCSLAEAVATLRVNLAALESVRTRQWVKVPHE